MKIGVFDSGRGGELIARTLCDLLPQHEYIVVNDRENVPYGSRTDDVVTTLTVQAIQPLLLAGCPIIIIACNTATMVAINTLRGRFPNVKFIGTEPMIKPAAAQSSTNHITVLATPLTLMSQRYRYLQEAYSNGAQIDEPNTTGWASAIESGSLGQIDMSSVQQSVASGSDVVVLACTHYIALIPLLKRTLPDRCAILEPTSAIARQVERLASPHVQ